MKKILLTILFLVAGINLYAQIYDFSAVSPSGHMLYYDYNEDSTLEVVHPRNDHSYSETNYYDPNNTFTQGELIIPDSVH